MLPLAPENSYGPFQEITESPLQLNQKSFVVFPPPRKMIKMQINRETAKAQGEGGWEKEA